MPEGEVVHTQGGPQVRIQLAPDKPAIPRPAVTGAKGSNVALASLITALVNLGLISDSTTA